MRSVEMAGRTVDEAVENGLKVLRITKDKVKVEVIEEGSKGLFGFLGTKPAKVKITVKENSEIVAKNFLKDVLDNMDINCDIHVKDEGEILRVELTGPKMGILIGHRGDTLDSLQYLLSLVVNKQNKDAEYKKVIVDTENYRKKREDTLIKLANRLAMKVNKYKKSITLEPMNPYERRIIHAALQDSPYVLTHSEGDEPYRKVVIEPKENS
jgi:spoIIIJ-associated protein